MDKTKLKRQIIDYLHKYATMDQLIKIARILGLTDGKGVK